MKNLILFILIIFSLLLSFSSCIQEDILEEVPTVVIDSVNSVQVWNNLYKKQFSVNVNFSGVKIPDKPEGNWRIIYIAKGLTVQQVYDSWNFNKEISYINDLSLFQNKRNSDKDYAVWIRDEVYPDPEKIHKPIKEVDPEMATGITLLEMMLFQTKYFSETGKYLGEMNATLCSGSRYPSEYDNTLIWVPVVFNNYDGVTLELEWVEFAPERTNFIFGVRSVVDNVSLAYFY
jgi:hypothetical protein